MELELQNVNIGSLKRHYRAPDFFFFFFKLNFEKIEFQKRGISLINLGKRVECYLVCPKRAEANFVPCFIIGASMLISSV